MSPKSDSDSSNHVRIDNLREHSSSVQEENKLKRVTNNILKPIPNNEKIQNLGDSRKSLVGNTIFINDQKSGLSVQADPKSVKTIAEEKIVQSETILKNSQSNESFTKIQLEAILKNSPSNEPLTKIDYKCKLCKFETLETSSLKSHMVTGHKVDETQTDWNKYISLCKRVVTIPKNKTNLDKSNATTDTKQDVSNKIVVEEAKLTSQKPVQASVNKDEAKTEEKPTCDGNIIEVSNF